ncbi:hypothetical protein WUBG_04169 [Wuchereria bancrofti]|uniref:Uncharacterized protein n=1 Tax=Wuchereria bancrofti TaxID=6293 RepID=J9BCK0_WUCBA|nr:hypothetical protein WUBG_04169 [Wuchereria bancrofti]
MTGWLLLEEDMENCSDKYNSSVLTSTTNSKQTTRCRMQDELIYKIKKLIADADRYNTMPSPIMKMNFFTVTARGASCRNPTIMLDNTSLDIYVQQYVIRP